jgi:hypothetical protein
MTDIFNFAQTQTLSVVTRLIERSDNEKMSVKLMHFVKSVGIDKSNSMDFKVSYLK